MTSKRYLRCGVFAAALLAIGCGDRAEEWSKPVNKPVGAYGLKGSVALIDTGADRALMLTAWQDQTIKTQSVPIGRNVAATAMSPDGARVFVASKGDPNPIKADDQRSALTVIESGSPAASTSYELPGTPVDLIVDPTGELVVVLAQEDFITNPNALIFVDPSKPYVLDQNPRVQNIPSLNAGSPQRFTFTPALHLANGDRRLLVIETERDVVLVDPADPRRPIVTLPLTDNRTNTVAVSPAGIAVDPGDATRNPCLAVRAASADSVYLFTFAPVVTTGLDDFKINVNTVYVGGTPSDIAFVNTNRGSKLAALVPSPAHAAVLVDVGNNHTLQASLPDAYSSMDLVTSSISGAAAGFDQALLWNGTSTAGGVALWDLGKVPDDTATQINTAESIVTYSLSGAVTDVTDVPGRPLKILTTSSAMASGSLYVFDLDRHTSAPLRAPYGVKLRVSRDGARAWAFLQSANKLARIDPSGSSGPSVATIPIERAIDDVFEIDRSDTGKALIALHGLTSSGLGGATVFDALAPDVRTSRLYSGLLLEGLSP
jgi:hypothetical protein